jgi:hypothetical protein
MAIVRKSLAAGLMMCVALSLAACEGSATLAKQQKIDRANLPLDRIDLAPVARPEATTNPSTEAATETAGAAPAPVPVEEPGTYTFTIPTTVTTVKQTNDVLQQYRLYLGQPKPTDLPFLVLTVAPNQTAPTKTGEPNPAYRTYRLNGLDTQEWKGYDLDHHPYCELLVAHSEHGDQLHAIAVARNAKERTLALEVLASIKWTPQEK